MRLISDVPLAETRRHLTSCDAEVEEGPIRRTGTIGPINSIYFCDSDDYLIEVANYL